MKRNLLSLLFLLTVVPIFFSCEDESTLVFGVDKDKYLIGEDGEDIVIEIQSNSEVTFFIDEMCSWITATNEVELEGHNKQFYFKIGVNLTGSPRSSTIEFSAKNYGDRLNVVIDQVRRTSIYPITDANFNTYLIKNFDKDGDGKISIDEAAAVKAIDCSNLNIKSIDGIKNFGNLRTLRCNDNQIKNINITTIGLLAELECYNNPLEILDMGETNPIFITENSKVDYPFFPDYTLLDSESFTVRSNKVRFISVANQKLRKLDVSLCLSLRKLLCQGNEISGLDITRNSNLEKLDCSDNKIISIDLSKNIKLDSLDCSENRITKLNLSKNKEIADLIVSYNDLQALDLRSNIKLETLLCNNNNIESIDVDNCLPLTYVDCSNNSMTHINLAANLSARALICNDNPLVEIDLGTSQINKLELIGGIKESTSFRLIGTNIQEIRVNENSLVTFDISEATSLQNLYCSNNQLNKLDITNNTKLKVIECYDNNLSTLNVANNSRIEKLICYDNKFTTLDISTTSLNGGVLDCAPMKAELSSLYIKANWVIPQIYPIRNPEFIPAETTISFK